MKNLKCGTACVGQCVRCAHMLLQAFLWLSSECLGCRRRNLTPGIMRRSLVGTETGELAAGHGGVWAEEHEAAGGEQWVFILTLITYTPARGGSRQLMRQIELVCIVIPNDNFSIPTCINLTDSADGMLPDLLGLFHISICERVNKKGMENGEAHSKQKSNNWNVIERPPLSFTLEVDQSELFTTS